MWTQLHGNTTTGNIISSSTYTNKVAQNNLFSDREIVKNKQQQFNVIAQLVINYLYNRIYAESLNIMFRNFFSIRNEYAEIFNSLQQNNIEDCSLSEKLLAYSLILYHPNIVCFRVYKSLNPWDLPVIPT